MTIRFPITLCTTVCLAFFTPATAQVRSPEPGAKQRLTAYPEAQERLPRDYAGVDAGEFFRTFKKRLGALKRGKSESVGKFQARVSDTDRLLRPISTKTSYAFRIPGLIGQYSSLKHGYSFGGSQGYGCMASGFREGYVTCPVAVSTREETPVAANDRKPAPVRRELHGLAIPIDSRFIQDHFKLDRNKFYFSGTLPASGETVGRVEDSRIAVLFVGNVIAERLANDQGQPLLPIVTHRREVTTVEYDVPFKVTKIVYYVPATGEILAQSEF